MGGVGVLLEKRNRRWGGRSQGKGRSIARNRRNRS